MNMAELTLTLDESSLDALIEAVKSGGMEALRPAQVTISAPYAAALEFGSMPAVNPGPKQPRPYHRRDGTLFYKETTEAFDNIYRWATRHASKLDPYTFACKVYSKVMEEGLAPHPYVRPALYEFEQEFEQVFRDRGSFHGAAEDLAERICRNIESGIAGGPMSDTGALANSIEVDYCDSDDDVPDYPDRAIWDVPNGDINGNPRGKA